MPKQAGQCLLKMPHVPRRVIHTFTPSVLDNFKFSGASDVGRGGMEAKVASAWDAAQAGVTTVIANGKLPSVLLRVCFAFYLHTLTSKYSQPQAVDSGQNCAAASLTI